MGRKKKAPPTIPGGGPAPAPPARRGWQLWVWPLVIWLAAFLTLFLTAKSAGRFSPFNNHFEHYTFISSFATLMIAAITTILVLNGLFRLHLSLWTTSLAAVIAAMTLLVPFETGGANLLQYLVLDAAVVVLAVGFGALGARLLKRAGHILPFLAAAAAIDILGVAWGPSLAAGARPELLSHFSFYYPLPGLGGEMWGLLELADVACVALIIAVGWRHGFDRRKLMISLVIAFMAVMICTWFTPAGLPVIPFLAIFVAAGEWRRLLAERQPLARAALVAAGGVALVVLARILFRRFAG